MNEEQRTQTSNQKSQAINETKLGQVLLILSGLLSKEMNGVFKDPISFRTALQS